jgi:hypothetical protein
MGASGEQASLGFLHLAGNKNRIYSRFECGAVLA